MDSYRLPVMTMMEAMKESTQVQNIQARLPSLPGLPGDACLVQMVLGQGQVYSCAITAITGAPLLQQQDALRILQRCGDLDWKVFPMSTPAMRKDRRVQGVSSRLAKAAVPSFRGKRPTTDRLQTFSHSYRLILLLVDGKRTIEDIARLTVRTPQEVVIMLRAMSDLISF